MLIHTAGAHVVTFFVSVELSSFFVASISSQAEIPLRGLKSYWTLQVLPDIKIQPRNPEKEKEAAMRTRWFGVV